MLTPPTERAGDPPQGEPRLRYSPALDGIRAVAVSAVLLEHGGMGWSAGGFIGVSAFFVLSGFLITTLLVQEWDTSGTIALLRFWARRARRLLPALLLLIVGVALYAWLFLPEGSRAAVRTDGLAALVYGSNWHEIVTGQNYFDAAGVPSPLLHTWSLAIEGQFYLVWPLVVLGVLRWRRSVRTLTVVAAALLVASAAEMVVAFHIGWSIDRLYYGTDTRAQDVLVGAVVALLLHGVAPARTGRARWLLDGLAGLGGLAFVAVWAAMDNSASFPFRGGLLLADVATALVVLGVTRVPDGAAATVLGVRPLVYIGSISYGLYLWHWPVFLVLDGARTGLGGWELFAVRVVVSVVIAALSSHFVEVPVRQGALRRWRLGRREGGTSDRRPLSVWLISAVAVAVAVGALLVATAVPASSADSLPPLTWGYNGPIPASSTLTRVVLVGDSVSLTTDLSMYRQAPAYGVVLREGSTIGCGVATAVPVEQRGVIGNLFPDCPQWPTVWTTAVHSFHPSVVGIVVGRWETMNRVYEGRWQHLGDPDFNAYVEAQLEKGVDLLLALHVKVALFTSPYFDSGEQPDGSPWPEDAPSRVDEFNRIVAEVAARHPGVVRVIPFGRYLDPQGHFTFTVGGVPVRLADGVHTTLGSGDYLAPLILPTLRAMGTPG